MNFTQWGAKALNLGPKVTASENIGDIYVSPSMQEQGIFKAYIPKYLYRPPFGYPRPENLQLMKTLAANPYIYSIEKTIIDEVSLAEWEIVYKEDAPLKDKLDDIKDSITKFFNNPNQNKESFTDIRKMAVKDILEVDSGVFVKVFNRKNQFCQMFARDGASFLKNTDIYGYIGNRAEFIPADEAHSWQIGQAGSKEVVKQYQWDHKEEAAYFQYGTSVSASIPVPFGRREVIYMMQNPKSDSPYGVSPIQILADIITTLVYGSFYNLDFYMNNNMPEGIVQLLGAEADEIKAFRNRIEKEFRVKDDNTGFTRKVAFKVPITQREAKFIPFQMDPKTMQILEQQQWFYKLALACFGVPPDEMGMTENSNKATGANQFRVYLRKSARPILALLKYKMDMEIISEWGEEAFQNLEFKWKDYDLDEEIKKHSLYQMQLNMGIATPEMIANEEGIDFTEVKKYQEEKRAQDLEMAQASAGNRINQTFQGGDYKPNEPAKDDDKNKNPKLGKKEKPEEKSLKPEDELEKELSNNIKEKEQKILKALENI